MITLKIDQINIDTSTETIIIASGIQRYKVETINATGYERLLLMPQTGSPIQMTMEVPDAEGNPVNAVIEFANDPLKIKQGVMCSVVREADAVDIRPTPMLLGNVVNLYRHLDETGKRQFINAFGADADLVRKALEDAGEITYDDSEEPTIYCNDNFRRNALIFLDRFYPLRESEKLLRNACDEILNAHNYN